MKKIYFKDSNNPFTFSILKIKSWTGQFKHFIIHFVLSLVSPEFSMGGALFIEVRDGEQGHLKDWKEGFNIFPDFMFRVAGVLIGYLLRNFVKGL